MALDAAGGDPCGKLNASAFPALWISETGTDTATLPLIAERGQIRTMISFLSGTGVNLDQNILTSPNANSTFRLIQFLSGGGVGGAGYQKLSKVVLGTETTPETIVDTFILGTAKGIGKSNYATSYGPSSLSESDISSIVQKLVDSGYLLKKDEIYIPGQMTTVNAPAVSSQTLLYLYKSEAKAPLTTQQESQKALLESKNLRFFGAFLAEYCFYRTRYRWSLKHYFDTFKNNNDSSKSEYLKGIATNLAVLNTRLIDLRRILSQISAMYTQMMTQIQNDINDAKVIGSNVDLNSVLTTLTTSSEDAKKYLSEKNFLEGAMKYTEEKNRHANILLGLYAFLNIAALAMVYKLR